MMNGRADRQRRFLDHYDNHTEVPFIYAILGYCALLAVGAYYILYRLDSYPLLSIPELLWNCLVYVTPSSLVLALEKRSLENSAGGDTQGAQYSESRTFAAKSNAMRRVLGWDGTGILSNIQRPRSLSGFSTVFKAPVKDGLPGLGNWDNSCYQNSVLQGLASLPSVKAFLEGATATNKATETTSTNKALWELITQLNNPKNAGKVFWTPSVLKSMSSWQQQDAQEYYSKVLDSVEKEVSKVANYKPTNAGLLEFKALVQGMRGDVDISKSLRNRDDKGSARDLSLARLRFQQLPEEFASTLLRNPLEGLLAQRVGCLQCGYVEGLSLIPFNCLTVQLGKQWLYTIETCLDEYATLEEISGVECAKCTLLRQRQQLERLLGQPKTPSTIGKPSLSIASQALLDSAKIRLAAVNEALESEDFTEQTLLKKCLIPSKSRVTTTKTKQAVIARAPKSLVMHVNRNRFDEMSGMQSKNYADVRFPSELDIAPWCIGDCSLTDNPDEAIEQWMTNPSTSMLEGDDSYIISPKPYALRAVVTHVGRVDNGHYICFRSQPNDTNEDDRTWWRLSDDDVMEVSRENVLSQGGVFMLFYERVGESVAVNQDPIVDLCGSNPVTMDLENRDVVDCVSLIDAAVPKLRDPSFLEDVDTVPALKEDSVPDFQEHIAQHAPLHNAVAEMKITKSRDAFNSETIVSLVQPTTPASESTTNQTESQAESIDVSNESRKLVAAMRIAGLRDRRESMSSPGNAIPAVSSMVTAN